MYSIFGDTSLH